MPRQKSMAEDKLAQARQAQATLVAADVVTSRKSWSPADATTFLVAAVADPDSGSDGSSEYDVVSRSDL